uniref:Uncharacterized protein n=1 Tax=Ananas comosus var. bracteatus TaxID=296719 RepID=A0A6V7NIG8_ANACO|nr:unnamed protein product [Ananas comosus var. bracteatus]
MAKAKAKAKGSVWEIEAEDVAAAWGVSREEAEGFRRALREAAGRHPREGAEAAVWAAAAAARLLRPEHPTPSTASSTTPSTPAGTPPPAARPLTGSPPRMNLSPPSSLLN